MVLWKVKAIRPEDLCKNPPEYFTLDVIQKYAKSASMKVIQRRLINRILELMNNPKEGRALDLGCGWGYSGELLLERGFSTSGVDIIKEFVKLSKSKGIAAYHLSVLELTKKFKKESFDYIFSISMFQWLSKEEFKKAAEQISYVLKRNGWVGIQFYPKTETELGDLARAFKKQGFSGRIVIDNPENPKKRTVFLVFQKKASDEI